MPRSSRRRTASTDAPPSATGTRISPVRAVQQWPPLAGDEVGDFVGRLIHAAPVVDAQHEDVDTDGGLSSPAVPSATTRPWSTTAMRCARRSASSRYCVVSSTVVPSLRSSSTVSQSSWRVRGSRPVVGSSRRSSGGRPVGRRRGRAGGASLLVGGDGAIRGVGEVETLEHVGGRGLGFGAPKAVQPSDHLEVLSTGQLGIDRRELAGKADHPAHRQLVGVDVVAEDRGVTTGRAKERRDDADKGCLPGAVRAEQAEHGAGLDAEVEAFEGDDVAVGLVYPLGGNGGGRGRLALHGGWSFSVGWWGTGAATSTESSGRRVARRAAVAKSSPPARK